MKVKNGLLALQLNLIVDGLSTRKLTAHEIVESFMIKVAELLEAYNQNAFNSGFFCRRVVSPSGEVCFIGGGILPGKKLLITTFPKKGEIGIELLAEKHPGPDKSFYVVHLANEFLKPD